MDMKRSKKTIVTVILLVLLAFPAGWAAGTFRLTLPVRVWEGGEPLTGLQKQDFTLRIDDLQQEILQVANRSASLGQPPEFLGRNFILSLHITDFGHQAQEGVSYFITEIVNTADSFILVTPLKIYRFPVTANKEKLTGEIEEVGKRDCDEFKRQLRAVEKNLEIQIHRLMQHLSTGIGTDPGLVDSYKAIGLFFSSFPQELMNFRNHYLFPQVDMYRRSLEFLGNRDGQRWWIHLQQGDCYEVVSKAYQAAKRIEQYCNLNQLAKQSFRTSLQVLEKQLQMADSFPGGQLLDIFWEENIRYNVILWEHHRHSENTPQSDVLAQMEGILHAVSRDSGGKLVHTTGPVEGMKRLRDHRDRYYELTFDLDGRMEEKKIVITTAAAQGKGTTLSYKSHLTAGEIRRLAEENSEERVHIGDFSLAGNTARFSIKSIAWDEKNTFGLVRVRLELVNPGEEGAVHRTENTLRASRRDIEVSIPLPRQYKGRFQLRITICDLRANRLATMERTIELF
jgi:hypothetical protein